MRLVSGTRTLCEVLREINDNSQDDSLKDKKTRRLLAEAVDMAKRMARKLVEYNKEYDKGWWDKNPDYKNQMKHALRSAKDYKAEECNNTKQQNAE